MSAKFGITKIEAYELLDSRGNPTVGADVYVDSGAGVVKGTAYVPSGASTGKYEAHELRDGDKQRYGGKGCLNAVKNANEILAPALLGFDVRDQRGLDAKMIELDGSENKKNIGANAILAVSLASARAAAESVSLPLWRYLGGVTGGIVFPRTMMNILNGGAHADNSLDIQEYMIVPVAAKSVSQSIEQCVEIFVKLKSILKSKGLSTGVGDEGGFAPNLKRDEDGLMLLVDAIEAAGYKPGKDVMLALDAATSEWAREDGTYLLPKAGKTLTGAQLVKFWKNLAGKYPILSIEDAAGEDDFPLWTELTAKLDTMLVGDDLFVTNPARLQMGIEQKAANSILVKPNQVGTLSETLEFIRVAKDAGMQVVLSHRSGETSDAAIADIAVSQNAGYIKTGAPCRGERTAKYNRLMEIEREVRGF